MYKMTSAEAAGGGARPRGPQSQFIQWDDDSDEDSGEGGGAAAATATTSACSSPSFCSSFLMVSPVMNSASQASQSPVHHSNLTAALRSTSSKRPHREEELSRYKGY